MRAYSVNANKQVAPNANGGQNATKENGKTKKPVGTGTLTLGFWVILLAAYVVWDLVVIRNTKLMDVVNPGNIRANLYNIFIIGLGAVVFINGMKVILVKVGALEWPVVSWIAKQFLPLFQL